MGGLYGMGLRHYIWTLMERLKLCIKEMNDEV